MRNKNIRGNQFESASLQDEHQAHGWDSSYTSQFGTTVATALGSFLDLTMDTLGAPTPSSLGWNAMPQSREMTFWAVHPNGPGDGNAEKHSGVIVSLSEIWPAGEREQEIADMLNIRVLPESQTGYLLLQ